MTDTTHHAQCPVCGSTDFFATATVQQRVSLVTWTPQYGSGDFLASALEPDKAAQKALQSAERSQIQCDCQECGHTLKLSELLGEPQENISPDIKEFDYKNPIGETFDPHY